MNKLWILAPAILILTALPAAAQVPESRLRLVAQPGYWEPNIITFPTLGMEAEIHLPGTAWSVGGVYTGYFSRYKAIAPEIDGFVTRWEDPRSQTLFARYSSSATLSWLMGIGSFGSGSGAAADIVSAPSSWQFQGPGLVLGLTYRPSLGPVWLQLSPNFVFAEVWANNVPDPDRIKSIFGYSRSGLSWLEVGLRLHPNIDLSLDPLTRTIRSSIVF